MGTPSHTLRFRIYEVDAADGPTVGALIGELTKVWGKTIRREFNDLGAGEFYINRHDDQAAWCVIDSSAPKRYVKAYLDDFSGPPVFGFFLTAAEVVAASDAEEGGETIRIGGPGPLSVLRTARVHPKEYKAAVSGEWASSATNTWEWANVAVGGPLIRQVEEAQERGAIPDVTVDFTRTHDSDGTAWDMTFDFSIPIGTDLWEMVTSLQEGGLIVEMDPDDFTLHAYAEFGTDLSDDVHFVYGVNIRGENTASKNIEAAGGGSWALIEGRTIASGASTYVTVDEVATRGIGHVEIFGQHQNTARVSFLSRFGHRLITQAMNAYDGTATIGVVEVENEAGDRMAAPYDKVALIDYVPGDTVFLDIPGVYDEQSPQVTAITIVETSGGEYDPIVELANINVGTGGVIVIPPTNQTPWVPCPPDTTPTVTLIQSETGGVVAPGNLIFDQDPSVGNTIICWVTKRNSGTIATPTNFTEVAQVGNIGGIRSAGLYYKLVQAGDTAASQVASAPWAADGRVSMAEFEGVYELDAFNSTAAGTVAHLTPGTVAGSGDAILYAFVAANQYGTHAITDTAPDGSLVEQYDDNSYGSDPWHYAAWEAYAGGDISDGVTWTQSPLQESGAVGATFIKTAGEGTGGSDCPPPVPGQQVAPLSLEVDCFTTAFTTPYPYQAGTLEVWIRNVRGELIRTIVEETEPERGRFTTPFAPCCNVSEQVILTGHDMTTGNFEILTSSLGRPLHGIEYADSLDGSCLVVGFIAASSDPTGITTVPPVPTVPPDAPPPMGSVTLPPSIDNTGTTDVTSALLTFFDSVPAGKTILFNPAGIYRVDGRLSIEDKNGFFVDGQGRTQGTGATLKRNSQSGDPNLNLWTLDGCTNSGVKGFQVDIKNTNPNVYDTGFEWQHALYLVRSRTVEVAYMTIITAKGDFVDADGDIGNPCRDIYIHDSWVTGLGRNGVSAICVDGLILQDVAFDEAALVGIIDCEPNYAGQTCTNILVEDCTITGTPVGSSEQTFGFAGPAFISDVTIRRVDATGFTNGLYTDGFTVGGARRSNILMEDCVAAGDIDHGRNASLFFTSTDGLTIRNVTQPIPYGDYMIRAVSCTGISLSGNSYAGAAGQIITT